MNGVFIHHTTSTCLLQHIQFTWQILQADTTLVKAFVDLFSISIFPIKYIGRGGHFGRGASLYCHWSQLLGRL